MPGADVPRFDSVTIDCPDPASLARFYAELFEWPVPDDDGQYVIVGPPSGGTAITFQRAQDYVAPTWPQSAVAQQMHLDLAVSDLEAAHQRAVGLGARLVDSQTTFRVYADPVGHLFCLCVI